jgi:hypothetical protein
VRLARAKARWATALAAVALVGCRFRYDQLELLSTGDDGGSTNGGAESSGNRSFGGASGSSGTVDGGASGTLEAGAGGAMEVGGSTGANGGTAGAAMAGASSNNGGDATGGAPSNCVPDVICSCEAFAGHDYRFCPVLAVRDAGLAACQSANMVLIRVDTPEENAWLLQQFVDHGMFLGSGSQIVILDGFDTQVGTTWTWNDGTVFWDGAPVDNLYTNWATPPKPSQGNCLGMTSDGKWVSRSCNSGNATVGCESP